MKTIDTNSLVRENIKRLKSYSSARDEFETKNETMIFLDANENPFDTGVNRYPDPLQLQLKNKLATMKGITASEILLGNGSDEVLDLLLRVFCEPNQDNIITLPPTYGMYKVLAEINALENREVVLTSDYQPNVEQILKIIDNRTKIIFLCSPNNPTGNSFSEKNILEILNQFQGIVVVDEAYIDFSTQESWLKKRKQYPNLVIVQTLSKAYGMAGIRLGIAYASTEIITLLNKIKPPYNINIQTQKIALDKLNNLEIIQNEINAIIESKVTLLKVLDSVKWIAEIYPTDANFVLIKVDNATLRYQQLLEKRIVIRNRSSDFGCENCLRITIGTKEENEYLIDVLQKI
ncbi:histidinol-phosphate transaminase [Flavobacterium sp. '19STA2R22 D10 B1']|uniref:histidinol-phosphate transaminase n=1 Tax=Flavobacterium aerium TaxID=3037261 RepID=UPI00278C3029|nr:histidinol-phosphate transaminase [Flavobacterium sp. '19STA2R22 D10 B1']